MSVYSDVTLTVEGPEEWIAHFKQEAQGVCDDCGQPWPLKFAALYAASNPEWESCRWAATRGMNELVETSPNKLEYHNGFNYWCVPVWFIKRVSEKFAPLIFTMCNVIECGDEVYEVKVWNGKRISDKQEHHQIENQMELDQYRTSPAPAPPTKPADPF